MHRPLILTVLFAACATPVPPPPAPGTVPGAGEPAPIEAGRTPDPGPYAPGFDAIHYAIDLDLTGATATSPRITAAARLELALTAPRRDTLVLDFTGLRTLDVRAGGARAGGALRDVAFRHDAGRLHIAVPPGIDAGDTMRVEVRYDGTPDDGLVIRDNVHGVRTAFADNWPDRARFWFPSIDHPGDKASVEFAVRAPAGWTVISNGPRADGRAPSQPPADGVWRFAATPPIPTYTMVIGAGPLTETLIDACADGAGKCVPTRLYTFAPDSARAWPSFARAGEMLTYYSALFARFPYAKLDHAQSATRFGGMENVGAIFYSEQAIANGADIEGTVAHEIVHQWFGDGVTEADWQHLWLSEGFASYFGNMYFEHADGDAAFRALVAEDRAAYLASNDAPLPLVDTTATRVPDLFGLLNTNSYQKGALVLHMLRGLLGDDAFLEGVRAYYREHEYGTALTADLQRALEQASGRDLDTFFDQWVYSPGHPVLRTTLTRDAQQQTVLTIEQIQPADWPTFHFDTEALVRSDAGEARVPVRVRGRTTTVRLPAAARPFEIILDPDLWLLHQSAEDGAPGGR